MDVAVGETIGEIEVGEVIDRVQLTSKEAKSERMTTKYVVDLNMRIKEHYPLTAPAVRPETIWRSANI